MQSALDRAMALTKLDFEHKPLRKKGSRYLANEDKQLKIGKMYGSWLIEGETFVERRGDGYRRYLAWATCQCKHKTRRQIDAGEVLNGTRRQCAICTRDKNSRQLTAMMS